MNKNIARGALRLLRRVNAVRQVEIAELMPRKRLNRRELHDKPQFFAVFGGMGGTASPTARSSP
jgi:hypothetical protein